MAKENKPQRGYTRLNNVVRSIAQKYSEKRKQRNSYGTNSEDPLIEIIDEMDLPPTGQTYPSHWD